MRDLSVLVTALDAVEKKLCEQCTVEDLAKECYISVSGLQKLFAYALNCSVGEYISKRRLSAAAYELVNTEKSIIDIALTYRYASPEVFSRAFLRFWGVLPSIFRREHRFSELFPKLEPNFDSGGCNMSGLRKVDITKLYDELKALKDTYVLCADICKLKTINDTYGYAAGDIIIAEAAKRMDSAITDEMMMFRIGPDEFVVVTRFYSLADAKGMAEKITELNGNCLIYEDKAIPLNIRIGISKIPGGGLRYKEVLGKMHEAIDKVKQDGTIIGVPEN